MAACVRPFGTIVPGLCLISARQLKFDLYPKSAVPEYWIVDPDNRHVRRYLLADGSYRYDGNYDAAIDLVW